MDTSRMVAPDAMHEDILFCDVSTMIEGARQRARAAVNTELVMLYWSIGKRLREDELGGKRAEYGQAVVKQLAARLTERHGRGYSRQNLERMMRFADWLDSTEKCSTLSSILSWSHFTELLAIPDEPRREFYAIFAAHERWSVRTLRARIDTKLYERTIAARGSVSGLHNELTALRDTGVAASLTFRDPYLLDFLDLPAEHSESDLERAILDDMQRFLLELGTGFAFVGRQKRMVVDGEDFYLDLLFYHLQLRCYLAIELKTRRLRPADLGQMKLYTAWLDQQLRGAQDEPTLGLVLCSGKGAEQVKLLGLESGAIRAAEYLTRDVRVEMQRRLAAASER